MEHIISHFISQLYGLVDHNYLARETFTGVSGSLNLHVILTTLGPPFLVNISLAHKTPIQQNLRHQSLR